MIANRNAKINLQFFNDKKLNLIIFFRFKELIDLDGTFVCFEEIVSIENKSDRILISFEKFIQKNDFVAFSH